MANNDITYVRNKFPTIEEINGGYLIPASAIKNSKFIKEKDIELYDFYGYFLLTDPSGAIIKATLHKP
jgi:hypothetical protein